MSQKTITIADEPAPYITAPGLESLARVVIVAASGFVDLAGRHRNAFEAQLRRWARDRVLWPAVIVTDPLDVAELEALRRGRLNRNHLTAAARSWWQTFGVLAWFSTSPAAAERFAASVIAGARRRVAQGMPA